MRVDHQFDVGAEPAASRLHASYTIGDRESVTAHHTHFCSGSAGRNEIQGLYIHGRYFSARTPNGANAGSPSTAWVPYRKRAQCRPERGSSTDIGHFASQPCRSFLAGVVFCSAGSPPLPIPTREEVLRRQKLLSRSAPEQRENVVAGNRRFQQPVRRDFANMSNLVSNRCNLANCALKTLLRISFIAQLKT